MVKNIQIHEFRIMCDTGVFNVEIKRKIENTSLPVRSTHVHDKHWQLDAHHLSERCTCVSAPGTGIDLSLYLSLKN